MNEPTHRSTAESFGSVDAGNHGGSAFGDVSTTVVIAVAEAEGVDPVSLEDPLHEWVDPDALDAVVESMDGGWVTFDVGDHRVRVDADGTVTVDPE